MVADRKKGKFDPNAQPPSRGYGSSHAKRPITALGAGPRNVFERMSSDVQRSTQSFEEKLREATTRAQGHEGHVGLGSAELTELGQHLGHIEILLNAMLEAVEGYATEVVRNTRAIDQNTLEVRENTKLLRRALGLDHPEIGPLTPTKPVISPEPPSDDIVVSQAPKRQDDRS